MALCLGGQCYILLNQGTYSSLKEPDSLENYDAAELQSIEQVDNLTSFDEDENSEYYYLQYYSDFLNRLCHFKFIPQTTIQEIADEYILNTKKSVERHNISLRKALDDAGVDQPRIDEIVNKVFDDDPFLKAQLQLNSEFKRIKCIQQSDFFVCPQEILLNKADVERGEKKHVYHYISIVESIKTLVQDSSFNKMIAKRKIFDDGKIRDLKDGSAYKENEYFRANPEAFSIILYSDAIEIKNVLGAAKGAYKIVQIYESG